MIARVFGIVFGLNNGGGIGQRALYRIRYEKSVAGLLKGSAVLFNGVRVGEVTALQIEPSAPRQIMVTINVDARTKDIDDRSIAQPQRFHRDLVFRLFQQSRL